MEIFNPVKKHLAAAFSVALLSSVPVLAQDTASAIRGKVLDATGQPDAETRVVVEDTRTGAIRTYTTNDEGTFYASNLPVGGPYIVKSVGEEINVESISLGDTYNLTIGGLSAAAIEETVVLGQSVPVAETATGPSAAFGIADMRSAVAIERDIKDVYQIDPRLSIDVDNGSPLNCAGKHPRFNSITLDGVSHNDRFGLNDNGYSTATGLPFPFDAIDQVAVELAPFDVTYGGFSACNINAVTKSGSNAWDGSVFYEFTGDSMRGDSLSSVADYGGSDVIEDADSYEETKIGFDVSGPLIEDKLFISLAYEETEFPQFIAQGYEGSGNGEERSWLSEDDFNTIADIAQTVYGYDAGGQASDGAQEDKKYMVRLDWNINEDHDLALIHNYYDGFQDRASDSDSNEFEFANHYYVKGAESEATTLILNSQWTNAWSTQFYLNSSELIDSQMNVGDVDFAEFQIYIGSDVIYLGADDSRQANELSYDSTLLKLSTQYLYGDHIFTAGYEREDLDIFNQFVQHAGGGEIRIFDDSDDGGLSGIDKFELGLFDRYYYGSGGGTNDADDAAASFSNALNSLYIQDEFYLDDHNLTLVAGLRYDWFESSDTPLYNESVSELIGVRNDAGLDGVDILMPRFGFTWDVLDEMTIRGGVGLYSGGNPNVWISNAWSNDGITNAQFQCNPGGDDACDFAEDRSLFDLSSSPGYEVPSELTDAVAAVTVEDGVTSNVVLLDPDYKQPGEWKYALGTTYQLSDTMTLDADVLVSRTRNAAYYVDLSQEIVGTTSTGQPIYDYVNGEDNLMLTNSDNDATSSTASLVLKKNYDFGLDLLFGWATTNANDISPMTSATASSNFDNTALLDINDPVAGTSNYEEKHRFTFQAKYAREFFDGLQTRVTLNAYRSAGQPTSWVMDGQDLEGDGYYGRHLLYVPSGYDDPNVVFGDDFDGAAFFDWASSQSLALGEYVTRNSATSRWNSRVDLRLDQELPTYIDGTFGRVFINIYNLGNLINDEWGHQYDGEFYSQEVVTASINDDGQFVFEEFDEADPDRFRQSQSFWEAKIGVEFHF